METMLPQLKFEPQCVALAEHAGQKLLSIPIILRSMVRHSSSKVSKSLIQTISGEPVDQRRDEYDQTNNHRYHGAH